MANAVLLHSIYATVSNAVLIHGVSASASTVSGNAVLIHGVSASSGGPVASAGSGLGSAEPGSVITLDGSASAGGGTLTYSWVQTAGPTVTITGTGATRTFVAPGSLDGVDLTFALTVTDSTSAASTSTVSFHILNSTEFVRRAGVWVPIVVSTRVSGVWV